MFVGEDGQIYRSIKTKKFTEIGFLDIVLTSWFMPSLNPGITFKKAEAKKMGIDYKSPQTYIKSSEGVRIPVDIN